MELNKLIGKVIQFNSDIDDFETYAEGGMKARVIGVIPKYTSLPDPQEHVYILHIDYSEFDEYNKQFETYNYYDKNGDPILNARQAGFYNVNDTIYMPNPYIDSWDKYLTVLDA